jgi:fibronectin-binding autotransporter adhesin
MDFQHAAPSEGKIMPTTRATHLRILSTLVVSALTLTLSATTALAGPGTAPVGTSRLGSIAPLDLGLPSTSFRSMHWPRFEVTEPANAHAPKATVKVNCDAGGNLQNKINAVGGGSTLLVKGTCVGNFQITGKALTLKGDPKATLDGNDAGNTLVMTPGNKTVTLIGLTITGGRSSLGAGIGKGNGHLVLQNVKLTDNVATAPGGAAGGGIFSFGGTIQIIHSFVTDNRATGTSGTVGGAGIAAADKKITIAHSTVSGNRATLNGDGTAAEGSAFYTADSALTVTDSTISGNRATTNGATTATAVGSVLYQTGTVTRPLTFKASKISGNTITASTPTGTATGVGTIYAAGPKVAITGSSLAGNSVSSLADTGSAVGVSAGVYTASGAVTVTHSAVSKNQVTVKGFTSSIAEAISLYAQRVAIKDSSISHNAGTAYGAGTLLAVGGTYSSKLSLVRSTVSGNRLAAAPGSSTAQAVGAGYYAGAAKVTASTISHNAATAETGAATTAQAVGGGGYQSVGTITNSTIASNTVKATASNGGGTATAVAGGLYGAGALHASTVAANHAKASAGGTETEVAGGTYGPFKLKGTIIAINVAKKGPDCFAGTISQGYNLIGKTFGCGISTKPTDITGKDPKLGKLANNGGPTQTMALLAGSPALEQIPPPACPVKTDQRGVKRPQGPKCDMGAYERKV